MRQHLCILSVALSLGLWARQSPSEAPRSAPDAPTQPQSRALPLLQQAEDLDPAPDRVLVRLEAAPSASGPWLYAYNGLNPGPLIRARKGDTLTVEFTNRLGAASTIHWHGLKVPFAMDGVAWRGAPVGDGESFTYTFTLNQAGTFWYHPHFNTENQVDGGLYGALVVEDEADPRPDQELVLLFDTEQEYDAQQDALPDGDPGRHGHGHARLGPRWRVNGQSAPLIHSASGGQVTRVRLINASNSAYLSLRWPGLRQIGSDQGLLAALATPESIVLGPGDRAEAEWLLGGEGFSVVTEPWSLNGGPALGDPVELVQVQLQEPAPAPQGLAWPFSGEAPGLDPGYADILYQFQGSDRTGVWLINGERFPNVTVEEVPFDAEVVLEVRNLSPTEHPFHLHGLAFEVLSINGAPPPRYMLEDTLNLRIRDRVRLRVRADNPGDWMTHCHILPHADDGMMTVLRVLEP